MGRFITREGMVVVIGGFLLVGTLFAGALEEKAQALKQERQTESSMPLEVEPPLPEIQIVEQAMEAVKADEKFDFTHNLQPSMREILMGKAVGCDKDNDRLIALMTMTHVYSPLRPAYFSQILYGAAYNKYSSDKVKLLLNYFSANSANKTCIDQAINYEIIEPIQNSKNFYGAFIRVEPINNTHQRSGKTPLFAALTSPFFDAASSTYTLLKHGADRSKYPALHLALFSFYIHPAENAQDVNKAFKVLMAKIFLLRAFGVDVNCQPPFNETAIDYAKRLAQLFLSDIEVRDEIAHADLRNKKLELCEYVLRTDQCNDLQQMVFNARTSEKPLHYDNLKELHERRFLAMINDRLGQLDVLENQRSSCQTEQLKIIFAPTRKKNWRAKTWKAQIIIEDAKGKVIA